MANIYLKLKAAQFKNKKVVLS